MAKTTHTLVSNDILNLLKFFSLFSKETMREITDKALVEYMRRKVPDIKQRYVKALKK